MNDLNPQFLVLVVFAACVGALIAGTTGVLAGIAIVCGLALAAPFVGALLS